MRGRRADFQAKSCIEIASTAGEHGRGGKDVGKFHAGEVEPHEGPQHTGSDHQDIGEHPRDRDPESRHHHIEENQPEKVITASPCPNTDTSRNQRAGPATATSSIRPAARSPSGNRRRKRWY